MFAAGMVASGDERLWSVPRRPDRPSGQTNPNTYAWSIRVPFSQIEVV